MQSFILCTQFDIAVVWVGNDLAQACVKLYPQKGHQSPWGHQMKSEIKL